ncbi:MAG: NUDIX hydrolase [Gammaproteobacteria bacterium]|nr:NUDIX hydrolase [Gammaproteobacteria bacterium]NNL49508.1 NUDIX hydrolase [Woeseiaceae bacterium]
MQSTDLTVAAVVEQEGRFLLVEEYVAGQRVFSQPGGHIESGESPEQAAVRETSEETGCDIACEDLVGVYLWIHPQTRRQYLRIIFAAQFLRCDERRILDDGIVARHWLTLEEINRRQSRLRSPAVLRCVNDYVSGQRQSDALLTGMLPLQHNVDRVIATAALV